MSLDLYLTITSYYLNLTLEGIVESTALGKQAGVKMVINNQ